MTVLMSTQGMLLCVQRQISFAPLDLFRPFIQLTVVFTVSRIPYPWLTRLSPTTLYRQAILTFLVHW